MRVFWFSVFFLVCGPVAAATPDTFKTPEYDRSGALDVINAAEAYARGYTGAGVTVGVIDEMIRINHPELAGKAATAAAVIEATGQAFAPDWNLDTHGSHVAGIVAARRDGVGMHGVAFDAAVWGGPILTASDVDILLDWDAYCAVRPEARIFNNSWGELEWTRYYDPLTLHDAISPLEYIETVKYDPLSIAILDHALDHPESVMVFAAANNGMNSPSLLALAPRYAGSDLGNWLSVGALDGSCITRSSGGTLSLSEGAVPWFSNLAGGAERWTVMAPGSLIISLDASTNGYMSMSGTSMAAPVVSGALALVQHAYPWMTGKQLADAVLTTADKDFSAPDYIVSFSRETEKIYIRIIDKKIPEPADTAAAKALVAQAHNKHPEAWLGYPLQGLYDYIDAGNYVIEGLTREQVFGRGILDAGKAVRGIALLDANRMRATDVTDVSDLPGRSKDALETFDTKGYVAEFGNDISQEQWKDDYHHPDFRTGGDNADAQALAGLAVGLRKTGAGTLILSGENTYKGATVVDGGNLVVAGRVDGTGGMLQNSDVLVHPDGLLLGDGEISKTLLNTGRVLPGWRGDTLTVGSYTQTEAGAMLIAFGPQGGHGALQATTADLKGNLLLTPRQNVFYPNALSLTLRDMVTATGPLTGNFAQVGVWSTSPTLDFSLAAHDMRGNNAVLGVSRAADVYSRYADSAGAASVGRALPGVASTARGNMRALLAALDWSSTGGSDVRRGLAQLGSEAYDAAGRASLLQQREFTSLLLRRMLGNESMRRMGSRRAARDEPLPSWQVWLTPFGSSAVRQDHGGTAGWASSGMGILGGMERRWDAGFTLGLHLALAGRRTDVNGWHNARMGTRGAYLGTHALYGPNQWDGFYLTGQARLGLEDNEMRRDVAFNGYARRNESRWTGLAGGALLGAGKDWTWDGYSAGPLAWLEYGFVRRPDLSETGGQASRLNVNGGICQSLPLSLGGHLGRVWKLSEKAGLAVDVLAAWRHELLDGTFRSNASFRGYSSADFSSATNLVGRDSLLAQGSLRLTRGRDFFAQVDLGGEFRTAGSSVNAGMSFGWEF